MFKYFLIRVAKKKNFYIAIVTGLIISVLYVVNDVLPYSDSKYRHCVYDIWIGGFTGSIYASILYLLIPLIVSFPMADFYLSDRLTGYYTYIQSRGKEKSYFTNLYACNFLIGGVVASLPLLSNIYLCYLFVADKKMDFITGETHIVTLYGKETLFEKLYYEHPLADIFITILIGGLLASISLAVSSLVKNIFVVWISAFVLNYLYESIVGIIIPNGSGTYHIMSYVQQIMPSGRADLTIMLMIMLVMLVSSVSVFYFGVKRNELY